MVTYRHTRVVFGLSCRPFLLGALVMSRLDNVHINIQPEGDILKKSFFVDNCLTGVDQLHKQESFIKEAQNALKLGCFY